MRDKLAYKLMTFILKRVATEKYRSLIELSINLGMFTLEGELEGLDRDKWSEQAKFGEFAYNNWEEFKDDV